jgi:hypothetical protein
LVESDLVDTSVFFQGDIAGLKITGQWQDNNKKTKLAFSISQLETIDSAKHFSIKNGSYENISSNHSKFCSIYYVDNNLFYYECSVGTENCDGQIFGIAKLDAYGKAQSLKMSNPDSECFLKFAFTKNKIKIEEGGDCTSSHGASCTFGGDFLNQ